MAVTEKIPTLLAKLTRTFKGLSASEKLVFGGLGSFILILSLGTLVVHARRNWLPYHLVLVAGRASGESYILSEALAEVVAKQTNIEIDVCPTGGTEDNLDLLEGKQAGGSDDQCQSGKKTSTLAEAQLATAQADIPPGPAARLVATLYEDRFQLVINPEKFQIAPSLETGKALPFDFNTLIGKVIDIPEGGGQRESFKAIARHFNPSLTSNGIEEEFRFQDAKGNRDKLLQADAVFRVRVLGNEEIRFLTVAIRGQKQERKWQLVPIEQAAAMQSTRHPVYKPSTIPQGAYQGSPSIPATDLDTIAVQRNLLARSDVPDWVVDKITTILSENRQDLKAAIPNRSGLPTAFDVESITPLIDRNKKPGDDSNVALHKGAIAYYDRDKPSFIQANADFLALILTIILLFGSWFLQVKAWSDRQKQLVSQRKEDERKEKVDRYIEQVMDEMKLQIRGHDTEIKMPDYVDTLKDLFKRQERMDQVFQAASENLDQEEISQEGFRVFSEAYKLAKEVIERAITENQRKFSSYYVQQVMDLLTQLNEGRHPDEVSTDLDATLQEVTEKSIQDKIFSRESFRTFTDVYNLVRSAIDRTSHQHLGSN